MPRDPRPVPMRWRTLIHSAHEGGHLVYSMDQGNLIRLATDEDANLIEGGVCYALCVQWLGLRARGLDLSQLYHSSTGFDHVTGIPGTVFTEQFDRFLDKELWRDSLLGGNDRGSVNRMTQVFAFAKQGLQIVADRTWPHAASANAVTPLQELMEHEDTLLLMAMYRQGGGSGHAIAMQSVAAVDEYRFFDPNFGHFRFRGFSNFSTYLTQFFTYVRYATTYDGTGRAYAAVPKGMNGVPAPRIPLDHPRINTTYFSPPSSTPAAVILDHQELRYSLALRREIHQRAGIARASGLRVFVLSPRNDDDYRRAVNTALMDASFLGTQGLRVWVTPLAGSRYSRLETRIHFF